MGGDCAGVWGGPIAVAGQEPEQVTLLTGPNRESGDVKMTCCIYIFGSFLLLVERCVADRLMPTAVHILQCQLKRSELPAAARSPHNRFHPAAPATHAQNHGWNVSALKL